MRLRTIGAAAASVLVLISYGCRAAQELTDKVNSAARQASDSDWGSCRKRNSIPLTAFRVEIDPVTHDYLLTQSAGSDLNEVKLVVAHVGVNGVPHSFHQYFAIWKNEDTKRIEPPQGEGVEKVQKLSINGTSTRGCVGVEWTFDQ